MEAYSLAGKIYIRAFHFNVLLPEGTTNLVVKKKIETPVDPQDFSSKNAFTFRNSARPKC
jgi:hypothetical protein